MPCIGHLEEELGRPVLSSHSATLWKVLRMVRVHEPVPRFGRLLEGAFKRESKKEERKF